MKKYNILFASHPDYSGNAKSLYEYMNKNCKDFNLSWVIYDNVNYEMLKSNGVICYKYDSEEFEESFKNIDIVFFTHDELLDKKENNQRFIYLGHGNSAKKFGYLLEDNTLAIQDKRYLSLMKNNIDYIICSSELWKTIYHSAFDIESERILPLGTPRTDYIYGSDGKMNLRKCGIDVYSYNKVIMYLPTFRNGLGRENDGFFSDNILNLENYDEKELEKYLEENNYLLIVKYHPYEINKKNIFDINNVVLLDDSIMTEKSITLTEIINGVDLIVADYSSAFSDFVILNRPVCFLTNDIEIYEKKRGIIFDNLEFWSPGPFIKTIREFRRETTKLFEDKGYFEKERRNYVKMNFGKNERNSACNIVKYLFKNDKVDIFSKEKNILDSEMLNLYNENLELKDNFSRISTHNLKLEKENKELDNELLYLKDELFKKNYELNAIYSSKEWRILERIRKIKK